jgi:hypothetical protein
MAEHTEHLTRTDIDVDRIIGDDSTESLREIANTENRLHGAPKDSWHRNTDSM